MRSLLLPGTRLLMIVGLSGACTRDASRAVVAAGRDAVRDTSMVHVIAITSGTAAIDYEGSPVQAGSNAQYVLLDCRIAAPPDRVDLSDFQLVRERTREPGTETNLGDHGDEAYFYWSYLDEAGRRLATPPAATRSFAVRLAFKVPLGTRTGYLFYWGLYWGPLTFPAVPPG